MIAVPSQSGIMDLHIDTSTLPQDFTQLEVTKTICPCYRDHGLYQPAALRIDAKFRGFSGGKEPLEARQLYERSTWHSSSRGNKEPECAQIRHDMLVPEDARPWWSFKRKFPLQIATKLCNGEVAFMNRGWVEGMICSNSKADKRLTSSEFANAPHDQLPAWQNELVLEDFRTHGRVATKNIRPFQDTSLQEEFIALS